MYCFIIQSIVYYNSACSHGTPAFISLSVTFDLMLNWATEICDNLTGNWRETSKAVIYLVSNGHKCKKIKMCDSNLILGNSCVHSYVVLSNNILYGSYFVSQTNYIFFQLTPFIPIS